MPGSSFWKRAAWFRLFPFMSTLTTDKLYDESQTAQPVDMPANGKMADLPVGSFNL